MNSKTSLTISGVAILIGQLGFVWNSTAVGMTFTAAALPLLLPAYVCLLRKLSRRRSQEERHERFNHNLSMNL